MGKRNYTHVQMLLSEIEAMIAEGKTQREVAEHFEFKDKYVVKNCSSGSGRSSESWRQGLFRGPREG